MPPIRRFPDCVTGVSRSVHSAARLRPTLHNDLGGLDLTSVLLEAHQLTKPGGRS